jgi:hypothetical protein
MQEPNSPKTYFDPSSPSHLSLGIFLDCGFLPSDQPILQIDRRSIGLTRSSIDGLGWTFLIISGLR